MFNLSASYWKRGERRVKLHSPPVSKHVRTFQSMWLVVYGVFLNLIGWFDMYDDLHKKNDWLMSFLVNQSHQRHRNDQPITHWDCTNIWRRVVWCGPMGVVCVLIGCDTWHRTHIAMSWFLSYLVPWTSLTGQLLNHYCLSVCLFSRL